MRPAAALALLAALAATARGEGAAAHGLPAIDRYDVILSRTPFGAPPPTTGDAAGAAGGAGAGADAPAPEPPPPCPVVLRSVSSFGGTPAAGLVDTASGRSFLLRRGESVGGYRLLDIDAALGAVVLAQGTNEFFVPLSYASGQPTNLVPAARAPYLTVFRPAAPAAPVPVAEPVAAAPAAGGATAPAADSAPARRSRRAAARVTDEEEAELVRRATVTDPDGSTHVSFRELNRLRIELRERKAAAAREAALAEENERLAAARAEADRRRAAEEAERKASEEAEKRRRAAVVEALARGYDVEVDFELTADEAATLREAGFAVPDAALDDDASAPEDSE